MQVGTNYESVRIVTNYETQLHTFVLFAPFFVFRTLTKDKGIPPLGSENKPMFYTATY